MACTGVSYEHQSTDVALTQDAPVDIGMRLYPKMIFWKRLEAWLVQLPALRE